MSKDTSKILKFLALAFAVLAIALVLENPQAALNLFKPKPKTPEAPPRLTYIPQYVLISFDGSKSISMWRDITALKDELKASSTPLNVTHYINAAYFLTESTRNFYIGPGQAPGQTNIGISDGIEDIKARILEVNKAVADGDEIAVHTVGHFSGLHWSKENWLEELTSFNAILFGLDKLYPSEQLPTLTLQPSDIIGFRAPYLDHDQNLYLALHDAPKYRYDSSEVAADSTSWPTKDDNGLWHIPLGLMNLGQHGPTILAMDYNWYLHDSNALDSIKKGTPEWQQIYDTTLTGMRDYFTKNYTNTRAPVLIGYHFEKWDSGVYWEALKTFAEETCGKPQVVCGTFKDLVKYLDEYGAPTKS